MTWYFKDNLLRTHLEKRQIYSSDFNSPPSVTVSNSNYILINSTLVPLGLAVFPDSLQYEGQVVAVKLPGSVGTASINIGVDSRNTIINKISIREAITNNPVVDVGTGKEVYGLLHCDISALDGDPVGAIGSENTQISFIIFNDDETISNVVINSTIEFTYNRIYSLRKLPDLTFMGESISADIVSFETDSVANAELHTGYNGEILYVNETQTFYSFVSSGASYVRDGLFVLNTLLGGNTRWIGVSGKYSLQNEPGSITTTTELKTAIAQIEDSISEQTQTGFSSWDSAGPYYSISGNDLTLLVSGKGRIRGKEISWSVPQTITLTLNSTTFIYIDSNGLINLVQNATLSLYQNNIVLFEALNEGTEVIVVKENHPYNFGSVEASRHLHLAIGTIFVPSAYDSRSIGANPQRITTGTGGVNSDREIKIVGNAYLEDHGLYTFISDSSGNAVNWKFFYTDSIGQWKKYSTQSQFPQVYNNGGTVTPLATTGTNHIGIFRLYASKDDPNTGIPSYFAVIDIDAYDNLLFANNAVTAGSPSYATNELFELEVAQLGYVIIENNVSGGYINEIIIEKQTNTSGVTISNPSVSHILLADRDTIDSHPSYAVSHIRLDTTLESVEDSLFRKEYLAAESLDPTGFIDRNETILSWDHPGRTLTIQPAVTQFVFWLKGYRYIVTTNQSKQISITNGLHYLYFDDSLTLIDDEFPPTNLLIKGVVLTSLLYWNNIQSIAIHVADERHGMVISWSTHDYLHFTFGTRYISGLLLDSFTIGDGSLDSHAQLDCANGIIKDEDIEISITNNIPQQLTPILQAPVFYRAGVDLWYRTEADNFPVVYSGKQGYVAGVITTIYTGASGRPAYNQNNAGTWQLTEVGAGNFFLIHFFATNDIYYPIITILGINVYTKEKEAQDAAYSEIQSLTGLPFIEFTPIGSVIYEGDETFANTPKARVIQTDIGTNYIDFRDTRTFRGISSTLPNQRSGDYTPALINISNVSGSTLNPIYYLGIGQELTLRGEMQISTTASGITQFRITLPFSSILGNTYILSGSGSESTGLFPLAIRGDTTNNEALFEFIAPASSTYVICFQFGYRIQ